MRHFIRGYFDGDGCFTITRGRNAKSPQRPIFKIVSCIQFCQDLANYFHLHLGVHLTVYTPSPNPKVGAVQCGNDKALSVIYRYLYDKSTICLSRKRDKLVSYLEQVKNRPAQWPPHTVEKDGVIFQFTSPKKGAAQLGVSQNGLSRLVNGKRMELDGYRLVKRGVPAWLMRETLPDQNPLDNPPQG